MFYFNQQASHIALIYGIWSFTFFTTYLFVMHKRMANFSFLHRKINKVFFLVCLWHSVHLSIYLINYSSTMSLVDLPLSASAVVIPVYKRAHYLERVLKSLEANPTFQDHPILISQDGSNPNMTQLLNQWTSTYPHIQVLQHYRKPWNFLGFLSSCFVEAAASDQFYYLLDTAFDHFKCNSVVVLEEDLWVSPDFLAFVEWVEEQVFKPHMEGVGIVHCHNEDLRIKKEDIVGEVHKMFWTDGFLVRGWITSRAFWEGYLRGMWTIFGNYDIHIGMRVLRDAKHRTLSPVVSRTMHIGIHGVTYQTSYESWLARDGAVVTPSFSMTNRTHPIEWSTRYN